MNQSLKSAGSYEKRSVKSSLHMVLWIFIWTGSMVLADKAELYGWYTQAWMPLAGIVINALLGMAMIFVFIGFLRQLDDLQRKIQFDALAIAMGVSLVGAFSYSLMTTSGFITDPEINDITVLMMVTYSAAVMVGQVRYR